MNPSVAAQIAALEAKKAEAIAAEDFGQATVLKAEIETLKKTPPSETPKAIVSIDILLDAVHPTANVGRCDRL